MSNSQENHLLLGAEEHLKQPSAVDETECFEPTVPQPSVSPVHSPAPPPKPRGLTPVVDECLRELGILPIPSKAIPETGLPPATGSEGDAEMVQPRETLVASAKTPLPPPREATAVELIGGIKRTILAQTHLAEDAAEIVAFWAISTWFQDALTVLPCLVITGAANDAWALLHVLRDLCGWATLLAGFRRSHLSVLRGYQTRLVWEPDLGQRTADLLSNLTDRLFLVVGGGSLGCHSAPTAIYAGENPGRHNIQNSIHIHLTATNQAPPARPQGLQKTIGSVRAQLDQYRKTNLNNVKAGTWVPVGLSSETAAIATALGRGVVDAPELRQKLVALLKTLDQQHGSELSNTMEAIVVEGIQSLNHGGLERAYVREIAAEANRLLKVRGETARLSPEKVGHLMKRLGLCTRRLSQSGNGLTFDNATVAGIQQLAAMYIMEDMPAKTEPSDESQATGNTSAM
jgi:hypothetical protein